MWVVFLVTTLLQLSLVLASSDDYTKLPEKTIYNLEEADVLFAAFIKEHSKQYDSDEVKYRFEVFKDNLRRFNEWNMNSTSAVYGITNLADLTRDEFMSLGTSAEDLTIYEENISDDYTYDKFSNEIKYYYPMDWRKRGVVTEVKDQGRCACGYIFSAIGVIEGQYAIKHHKLVNLSAQQVLDCTESFTCQGDTSSSPKEALQSMQLRGIMTDDDYPFEEEKGSCKFHKENATAFVKHVNEFKIPGVGHREIIDILNVNGPLAIALMVAESLQGYKGGIFLYPQTEKSTIKDSYRKFYLLLVGHGRDPQYSYLIFKNSWGKKWGEEGYIRFDRSSLNIFGDFITHATVY